MLAPRQLRDTAFAEQPSTSTEWLQGSTTVNDALRTLGAISGIDIPLYSGPETPNERGKTLTEQIKHHFNDLFYLDRYVLEQEIRNFLEWLHVHTEHYERVNFLNQKLTKAVKACMCARSIKWRRSSISLHRIDTAQLPKSAPRSPTLSIKHGPHVLDQIDEIQLPLSKITSNNTSFVNTSFWSELQKGSQDPPSPATTVDDNFYPTEYYGSSWSNTLQSKLADAANEDLARASTSTNMPLNGVNDTSTQLIHYGSSPSLSAIDLLDQAQSHQINGPRLPIQGPATVPDTLTSPARQTAAAFASKYERVRNIVGNGFNTIRMPPSFEALSFGLYAECFRLLQSCEDLTADELDQIWRHPRNIETLHMIASERCPRFRRNIEVSYKDHSLCAKLRWTHSLKQKDPLFKLELLPPQKQLPNAFQQRFGCHRILFLDIDSLLEPPRALGLGDQSEHVRQRVEEMLGTEHKFLGRIWLPFHASEKTRKRFGESKSFGTHQLMCFALQGNGLEPLGLHSPIDFALPLKQNAARPLHKMNARLDLCASRPLGIIRLQRHEVEFVDDSYASDDAPDVLFNDPNPDFDFYEKYDAETVMNDGCSEAHESIFWKIKEELNLSYVPSAAQFRCAGAKGIIFMRMPQRDEEDGEDGTSRPRGPLMKITKSQSKVILKEEFDPHIFTLNIIAVSKPLVPSYLYSDFIPILVDRHVPPDVIKEHAATQAQRDMEDFLKALDSPECLREWIYRQNAGLENFRRDSEILTIAGFPKEMTEKAIQLLEAGFDATKFEPLAELVKKIGKCYLKEQKKKFKIQVGKSTMAFAIADPIGTLKPGEIQLNFSSPFYDPVSGRSWSHLRSPVLVTRNPSARSSDIQKVQAVYRPELSHILDVVIFSSRGRRPLADKCSGGDYDGDKFWICWESALVKSFLNAPAPPSPADPELYGIEVDKRLLKDVIPDPECEASVREFAHMGIVRNLLPSLLGTVTKTLEKLKYRENSLASSTVEEVTNVKDLIIDSKKNGRTLSPEVWSRFKKERGINDLPPPAYDITSEEESSASANPANILDNVFCLIVPPILNKAREGLYKRLANASAYDEDLVRFYKQTIDDAPIGSLVQVELAKLPQKLAEVKDLWYEQTDLFAKSELSPKPVRWETATLLCREMFEKIQPDNLTHDTVVEWLRRRSRNSPTTWDFLKTSALATYYHNGLLWHQVAGNELCMLKLSAAGEEVRAMTKKSYKLLNLRKRKRPAQEIPEEDPFGWVDLDVDMEE